MARAKHLLSARQVTALLKRGERRRYADGGSLYLQVSGSGRGSWVCMWKTGGRKGKQRLLGLGSVHDVSLKEARDLADACRRALRQGRDPRTVLAEASGEMTFDAAARELIDSMAPSWRNAKHWAQWRMTLLSETPPDCDSKSDKTRFDYCGLIRNSSITKLTTEDALRVLKPIWQSRPETASRLRGRCERVWDFAKARGHCAGENPFRWRGHLDAVLPPRARLTRGHHKAMPFTLVPAFMGKLRAMQGAAPHALEYTILTAARSGEVLGAKWGEIDLQAKVWTVPAERMKAGKEHRVPLSDRAVAILEEMQQARLSEFLFPGFRLGAQLSDMSLMAVLRRMKVDATVHGFRSAFRDWAGDSTGFPRDVVEAALAHAIENKTEAAYRRGDALEKRRKLMAAWDRYCTAPAQSNLTAAASRGEGPASPHN
jgi:integrase